MNSLRGQAPSRLDSLLIHISDIFRIPAKRLEIIRAGMLGNSMFLIGGSVASTIGGFLFWLLAARLTSPANVGLAAALIASTALLISLSDMGMSVTLVRYSAISTSRHMLINTAVRLAIILGAFAAVIFLIGLPLWSPALLVARQNILLVTLFLLFTVSNQIMAYQDMAMLAAGKPQFIFWRNVACNVPTSLFLIALVTVIKHETVVAYAFMLPNLIVVAYTGLIALPKAVPGYKFLGKIEPATIRGAWRYGFTNHLGNLLWALPAYLLPILAVSFGSLEGGGVFAITWALVGAIFIIPRSVSTSLFTQLSRSESSRRRSIVVSGVIVFGLGVPSMFIFWRIGPWLLSLFGNSYVDTGLLWTMLLSFIPFSINTLLFSLLRVSKQVWWIVIFSASYALVVIMTILAMSTAGIQGIAAGWLVGNALALVPGSIIVFLSQRHDREVS